MPVNDADDSDEAPQKPLSQEPSAEASGHEPSAHDVSQLPKTMPIPSRPQAPAHNGLELAKTIPVGIFATPLGLNHWEPISPAELNKLLPGYEVISLLRKGGMGAVYKATQKSLDRTVAIKVLPPELSREGDFEARFRREAKSMAMLNHPNIVHIHDFGQTSAGHYYFVMEFIDGTDLFTLIKQGPVNPVTAIKVVIEICKALQFAHERKFIHRDIKPANVMLSSSGNVKVVDFGISKLIDPDKAVGTDFESLTMAGFTLGTPDYAAPEAKKGETDIDHRADLYSLGVLFYETLTGVLPRGTCAHPSTKVAVDHRVDATVFKAMEEFPKDRHQSAAEFASELEAILADPEGKNSGKKKRKRKSKGQNKFGLVASILFLGGVLGVSLSLKPWKGDFQSPPPGPETWSAESPVADLLFYLGEKRPTHFIEDIKDVQINKGDTLVHEGHVGSGNGATPQISAYFKCTDCHNTVREDRDPAQISDPADKLAFAVAKDLPLVPGSSFAGIVNRETWFNDDYFKKFRDAPSGRSAKNSLLDAIDLCCEEGAQGRKPEKWETDALLAYFWSLQWKIKDLEITGEELANWKRQALQVENHPALINEIKGKYAVKSPGTFGGVPKDVKVGFPINTAPDLEVGKQVFTRSCLHCHNPSTGATETYFRDDEKTHTELSQKFQSGSEDSAYHHIRLGTYSMDEERLYMPNFTIERLSDFQIESLRAYLAK